MTEAKPEKPGGLSTRGALLAGLGIVVVLGLAFILAVTISPIWSTNRVLRNTGPSPSDWAAAVDRLGGPERAAERLSSYLRLNLPEWAAPHTWRAVDVLSSCGEPATPALERLVKEDLQPDSDPCSALGCYAVRILGELGPEATSAIPTLETAVREGDEILSRAASSALRKIHGEP